VRHGGRLDAWQSRLVTQLVHEVCERWDQPDEGIWEIRCDRRRHTYSAAMCAVSLDCALAMGEAGLLRIPAERLRRVRRAIRDSIEARGVDRESGSYVSAFGGHEVDASLLLLALHGYVAPDDPRMVATWERIDRELGEGELMRRYGPGWGDGMPPGEGAFVACGFWAVEYLARLGRVDEANQRFDRLLAHANDVGLLAEEVDPDSGRALGNFPQAFSHLGVINAALALAGPGEAGAPLRPGPDSKTAAEALESVPKMAAESLEAVR